MQSGLILQQRISHNSGHIVFVMNETVICILFHLPFLVVSQYRFLQLFFGKTHLSDPIHFDFLMSRVSSFDQFKVLQHRTVHFDVKISHGCVGVA